MFALTLPFPWLTSNKEDEAGVLHSGLTASVPLPATSHELIAERFATICCAVRKRRRRRMWCSTSAPCRRRIFLRRCGRSGCARPAVTTPPSSTRSTRGNPPHAHAAADVAFRHARRHPLDARAELAARARHERALLSPVGPRREGDCQGVRDDPSRTRAAGTDDARRTGGAAQAREGAGRRIEARLPHDARRARRRDLQRPAARQAVHLCAA